GLPWVTAAEQLRWTVAAVDFAFDCGARAVSFIPTRSGNGAMDALAAKGDFVSPELALLEDALAEGLRLRRGLVFADLWDLETFSACRECFGSGNERVERQNSPHTGAARTAFG